MSNRKSQVVTARQESASLGVLPEDLGTYDRVAVLMENATRARPRVALAAALASMRSSPNGWNTVLQRAVTRNPSYTSRDDDPDLGVGDGRSPPTRPRCPCAHALVPPALVASQQPLTATFGVDGEAESALLLPDAGHVTINGSFVGRATRADILRRRTRSFARRGI